MSASTKILLAACLLLIVAGIYFRKKSPSATAVHISDNTLKVNTLQVEAFAAEAGWGYTIYRQGKPYIRQNTIPAVEGNQGFSSRDKALQAGQLVIHKIEQSILPPTVRKQELDSLHLLN